MFLKNERKKVKKQLEAVKVVQGLYAEHIRNDEKGYYEMERLKNELMEDLKEIDEEIEYENNLDYFLT